MKRFFYQLSCAFLVGLAIVIGLNFLIPGWTRSDLISIFTLIVAVGITGMTRWDYIRQNELTHKPIDHKPAKSRDKRIGSLHFTLEKKSSGTFDLFARNNGSVDIREVVFKTTPLGNTPMPSFTHERDKAISLLRPHEKITVAHGRFDRKSGISFEIEADWKDQTGKFQKQTKTMIYK